MRLSTKDAMSFFVDYCMIAFSSCVDMSSDRSAKNSS